MPDLQAFISVLRPTRADMLITGPTEPESRAIGEHLHYLKSLCDRSVVTLAGRTTDDNDRTFGIAISRAADRAAAEQLVAADPVIRAGVMTADLRPFRIAMFSVPV